MIVATLVFASLELASPDFREGWRFRREGGELQTVTIPHDDAIRHDFDPSRYDTGCGALPYFGEAVYERRIDVSDDEWRRLSCGEDSWRLEFDGVSQGRRMKRWHCYGNAVRLRWEGVRFVPGEISVKTWKDGRPWAEDRRVTSGSFDHFAFEDARYGGKYVFRTVRAVDRDGNVVPDAAIEVDLPPPEGCEVFGTCNGDAADMRSLRSPNVKTFSGMALVVYRNVKGALVK